MARVSIQVNRVHVAEILDVAARQTYDVEVAIELDEVPPGCSELIVKRVSRLPSTDYHFPETRLRIEPGVTQYTVTGTLRFDYAQSEGSQPIEVKLLVRTVENDSEHDVDLVGTPAIQVRVGDAAAAIPAPRPAAHKAGNGREPVPGFRLSDDGRSANLHDRPFGLTTQQSQVVEMLLEAYLNKTPELSQAYILNQIGSNAEELRDTFRTGDAWGVLIVPGSTRGTFRLNL